MRYDRRSPDPQHSYEYVDNQPSDHYRSSAGGLPRYDRYGTDPAIYVEARYELGRIYLSQKKYDKAYEAFNEILDIYDSYGSMLPGAYKKLCNISLSQIPAAKLQELENK